MDGNLLLASFTFGMVGLGMMMYGKKAGRLIPLGSGLGLIVVPYILPNLMAMLIVCGVLTTLPWILREG